MIKLSHGSLQPRRITLTPLIDVVFILLVFFMLETTFREEGGMQLLSAEGGNAGGTQQTIVIELFDRESLWIDGRKIRFEEWMRRREAIDAAAEVRTAPGIPVQHVVDVVDTLKERGAVPIRLAKVPGFGG